ncbi:MAG: single-stranded DNA-binding protein [SAR202 cluster bacterium Io17-Chloro-G3]|nr:MAG: single-stranded DNA-binding protein [SAR202 cluster bacterium Io17-Chloro-G3]
MAGLNKIMIIGNVVTDPEMRYTPNGAAVTSFRVPTNRTYTSSDGERHEETEWFTVVAWNQLAELCNQYLSKGRSVYVEGRLQSRTWETREGQSRFTNEIIANQVLFLDRAPAGQVADGETAAPAVVPSESVSVDDLPF